MSQFDPFVIRSFYRKGKKCYYSFNDELYAPSFPEEWVTTHLPSTGPKDCDNCAFYGSWNGVFTSYCTNCAIYEYNGTRGRGFISCGEENNETPNVLLIPSAWDTYLKDVKLHDVGDIDFNDTLKNIVDQISADIGDKCDIVNKICDYNDQDPREVLSKICDAYKLLNNNNMNIDDVKRSVAEGEGEQMESVDGSRRVLELEPVKISIDYIPDIIEKEHTLL